mmetsp:Transcript_8428/g.11923  ORF Transcript_8428/g.11923 Transcript_8428/m.11923 type:complete len:213 (+) Transcript_8428:201-839(+)
MSPPLRPKTFISAFRADISLSCIFTSLMISSFSRSTRSDPLSESTLIFLAVLFKASSRSSCVLRSISIFSNPYVFFCMVSDRLSLAWRILSSKSFRVMWNCSSFIANFLFISSNTSKDVFCLRMFKSILRPNFRACTSSHLAISFSICCCFFFKSTLRTFPCLSKWAYLAFNCSPSCSTFTKFSASFPFCSAVRISPLVMSGGMDPFSKNRI